MTIGEVSRRLGIPASTIRFYERRGLIEAPRRVGGRRDYDDFSLSAIRLVQMARRAGFSVAETGTLVENRRRSTRPPDFWGVVAEAKKKEVRRQIQRLEDQERLLSALAGCDCRSLSDCVEGIDSSSLGSAPGGKAS